MILSELNYYNTNSRQLSVFREGDTRKNRTSSIGPRLDPFSLENYENLKLEELEAEIKMHHDFILEDLIPLLSLDTAMFQGSEEILAGLTLFGTNSPVCKSVTPTGSNTKESQIAAIQMEHTQYQKLMKELCPRKP